MNALTSIGHGPSARWDHERTARTDGGRMSFSARAHDVVRFRDRTFPNSRGPRAAGHRPDRVRCRSVCATYGRPGMTDLVAVGTDADGNEFVTEFAFAFQPV